MASDQLWKFCSVTITWTPVEGSREEAWPAARGFHTMAAVGDHIYMYGGLPVAEPSDIFNYLALKGAAIFALRLCASLAVRHIWMTISYAQMQV